MSSSELLQRALAGSLSPTEFDRNLRDLEVSYRPRFRVYQAGEAVMFRARDLQHLARPTSASELSYPPKQLTGPGRANAEGEQVFYASSRFAPSFMECGLKVGEYVICSRWRNLTRIVMRELGFNVDQDRSGLEGTFRDLFTDPHPLIYGYSAQVARRMMRKEGIAGVAYPSRAANARTENYALKPSAVREALRAIDASLYRVKKSDGDWHVLEEIDFARAGDGGVLLWQGKPARHNGELRVVTEECEYRAYDGDGNLFEAA
ncbi:MAG TPA: RES family NAD+ phosphorylase [Terriglobales bacterium]